MTRKIVLLSLAPALALGLWACGGSTAKSPAEKSPAPNPAAQAALPAGLFLEAAPEQAVDVGKLKESAKEHDEVVVRGRIGGDHHPFVEGSAVMFLVDPELKSCGETGEEDHCQTPWDFCCEPKEKRTANMLTVQLVDESGKPLKTGLKGQHGLKELSTVIVKGKVGPRPDPKILVVNATGLYVEPGK
ncbi:MAG: hypothetical protein M5U26_24135 [Planctomycetota bacterium]|nr:hypothetical protein [Planctomycetota bacterium]